MRRIIRGAAALSVAALVASGAAAKAEDKEQTVTRAHVPPPVLAAFAQRWPHATVRGYSRETENGAVFYEVESAEGGTTRDVLFHADGSIAVVEESIPASALPAAARRTLAALRPPGSVRLAEKVMRADATEYEVHVRQNGKTREILFDAQGKRLK
jgi:hypothetical protein